MQGAMEPLAQNERKGYPVVASEYKLLEEVGQGVSATVYRALCLPFNEVVAVKSLDLEKCLSNLDVIRREAQMMSLISHPNVVKAYCSFVVDQSLWVVMPYMAGGSCLHIMKSAYPDGFDEPVIATLLKEALKALDYLHRHGHIHRDVKAGNILVDSNGAVKLGDFGVSACMFDTGDRQRSRNTFVGTPCWMAPEVMEQLHGYDFKADIWSFGITALELAHGHAPFSKYPPMKVLLMTLQNAPPGLDYERDKRFSKSFKEMIAMCLVKDPVKRPSAEKLLKHTFFKHAKGFDYVARHVLDGLPPLGERVLNLKIKDAARLAQKKMPYGEQEERSQNEYKRGVSSWNFNVEDLKAQAAMIQDDDYHSGRKEEVELPKFRGQKGSDDGTDALVCLSVNSIPCGVSDFERPPQAITARFVKAETSTDAGDRGLRVRSASLSTLVQSKSLNGPRGRFDRFEDDAELGSSSLHASFKVSELNPGDERDLGRRDRSDDQDGQDEKDQRRVEDRDDTGRLAGSILGSERTLSRNRDDDKDRERDREHRQAVRASEDLPRPSTQLRERTHSGLLTSTGNKDVLDEKPKAAIVQKKGRFSVTSEDSDSVDTPSLHKSAVVAEWSPERKHVMVSHSAAAAQSLPSTAFSATVPVAAIVPHLQTILHHCAAQQDLLAHLVSSLSSGELPSAQQRLTHASSNLSHSNLSHGSSKNFLRSPSVGDFLIDHTSTDKEREHIQQVRELQNRISQLEDELQTLKLRNVQVERQLKEDRIRKEDG